MTAFKAKALASLRQLAKGDEAVTSMQVALGCAALALVFTLALTPSSENIANRIALQSPLAGDNIDRVVTGSIKKSTTRRYTIRRSVLQKDPHATCTIYDDGTREGDC